MAQSSATIFRVSVHLRCTEKHMCKSWARNESPSNRIPLNTKKRVGWDHDQWINAVLIEINKPTREKQPGEFLQNRCSVAYFSDYGKDDLNCAKILVTWAFKWETVPLRRQQTYTFATCCQSRFYRHVCACVVTPQGDLRVLPCLFHLCCCLLRLSRYLWLSLLWAESGPPLSVENMGEGLCAPLMVITWQCLADNKVKHFALRW
jgi:hypothetical protein